MKAREKELKLIEKALADRAFAKRVHKALKKTIRRWYQWEKAVYRKWEHNAKMIGDPTIMAQYRRPKLNYSKIDWSESNEVALLKGTHFDRMYGLTESDYLHVGHGKPPKEVIDTKKAYSGHTRLRGMVEVSVQGAYHNSTTHVGRAFCVWEDEFDLLVGTILAEYRLIRIMKRRGAMKRKKDNAKT
jgi:hypothetical protein